MTTTVLWLVTVVGSIVCLALKGLGYLVPEHWLADERVARISALVTGALLAALVAVQALGDGRHLVVDARLPAVVVAAIALTLRAPFLLVVVLAAVTAAGLRALGWG